MLLLATLLSAHAQAASCDAILGRIEGMTKDKGAGISTGSSSMWIGVSTPPPMSGSTSMLTTS